ncbi:MAG: N-acetyltransferase [Pyrinomonadaceae bacterium]|nr:N-acetyltransferase [Pyrinomonadaceae bacterium]
MKIQRDEHGKKGAFYIEQNGDWIAEMTYVRTGENEITIDHTEVDESLRGEGIGEDLVAEGVKYARENNLRIVATCPFTRKVINDTPEFHDVLAD